MELWLSLYFAYFIAAASVASVLVWWKLPFPARLPAYLAIGALASIEYFAIFASQALYGLWVSTASCLLIAAGAAWELLALRKALRSLQDTADS